MKSGKLFSITLLKSVSHISLQIRLVLLMLLITGVLFQTYTRTKANFQIFGPATTIHGRPLGTAISELKYGSGQLIGYNKVLQVFQPIMKNGVEFGPELAVVNKAIERALNLEGVTSAGRYIDTYDGLSGFYKLAFLIFGFKAESVFYLYWLLLATSVLIFLVTFYDRPVLLFYLLLFSCALFAILQTQAALVESVVRSRLLIVPTILPAFYLALLIAGERQGNWVSSLGAAGQALILAFFTYIRPVAIYQYMFLMSVTCVLLVLRYKKPKIKLLKLIQPKSFQFWPLAIALLIFILIRLVTLNPALSTSLLNRRGTWHNFYLGMAQDGCSLAYNNYRHLQGDERIREIVRGRMSEVGYDELVGPPLLPGEAVDSSKKVVYTNDQIYNEIVRDEYLRVFKQDPWCVINSSRFRLSRYFRVYMSPMDYEAIKSHQENPLNTRFSVKSFGVREHLIDWPVAIAMILGIFLVKDISLRKWFLAEFLLLAAFFLAFLVPISYVPNSDIIVDSALYLTIILLALIAGGVCYTIQILQGRSDGKKWVNLIYSGLIVLLALALLRGILYNPSVLASRLHEDQDVRFYGQVVDDLDSMWHDDVRRFSFFLFQSKYYGLSWDVWPLNPMDKNAWTACQARSQCFVGASLEEVKMQVDQSSWSEQVDRLLLEEYKGFNLIRTPHRGYYAVDQGLDTMTPMLLDDNHLLEQCQTYNQCVSAQTPRELKQSVDVLTSQLTQTQDNQLWPGPIVAVYTSSTHPGLSSSGLLFDNVADPLNAWHSEQWPDFPQWIDIVFDEPIELKWVGFEAQIDYPGRAPRKVSVFGGDALEQELAHLTFEFDDGRDWVFHQLPDTDQKMKRYRFLITDTHQPSEHLTIQEMQFYLLVEIDYRGFTIITDGDKFYIWAKDLGPLNLPQLASHGLEEFQTFCIINGSKCGIANSLEEAKQLVDRYYQQMSEVID